MKLKILTLLILSGSLAHAFTAEFRAANVQDASRMCKALLGPQAVLTKVEHGTQHRPGKDEPLKGSHYVAVDCADRRLTDAQSAEKLAEGMVDSERYLKEIALIGLNRLGIYSPSILVNATKVLDNVHVPLAMQTIRFLSKGGRQAIPYLRPLLRSNDSTMRYKVTSIFFKMAEAGNGLDLGHLFNDLIQRYVDETYDMAVDDPYPLASKINIIQMFGHVPLKTPIAFAEKVLFDLRNSDLSHEYAGTAFGSGDTLGEAAVFALGRMGSFVAPILGKALARDLAGPFVAGESYLLLAAEALGGQGKSLIPVLEQIAANPQCAYPSRVELTIRRLKSS